MKKFFFVLFTIEALNVKREPYGLTAIIEYNKGNKMVGEIKKFPLI